MEDEVDYESLGGQHPMFVHATAGAFAGYFEVSFKPRPFDEIRPLKTYHI